MRRQELVGAGDDRAGVQMNVVERCRAQDLAAVGHQVVEEPVVGEFGATVAEHDQSARTGPHPRQHRMNGVLAAVQLGAGTVRQEGQLPLGDGSFLVAAQGDTGGQVQVRLQTQRASGRVHHGRDAVEVRMEQVGQAHQRVLVKTWKPTRFSRKPYGLKRVCRRPSGSSSAR
ncbi:hypothetical protein WKI71_37325 [Streptomyces sp. MS1.AVA.1]|uniref:Uncharacterized protein n=1 Tax=Streptomyces machairae TaxID=3134109 RepID=A0ABU8USV4_9ACTN